MTNNGFDKENLTEVLRSLREHPGGIPAVVQTYESLAEFYRKTGHPDRALQMYQRSLRMHKQKGDVRGMVRTHNSLGLLYEDIGEWAKAKDSYQKSLETLEELGDHRGAASALLNLAVVNLEMDEEDEAKRCLARAYLIRSEHGLPHAEGLLETLEEVCESKEAAEAYLAQLS